MKKQFKGVVTFGAALILVPIFARAQQPADIGKQQYVLSCVVCQGDTGKGDGPLAGLLKKSPANLTTLQKNNNGVFPFARVYDVIDGREEVAAHGPRAMPIWGATFNREEAAKLGAGMFVDAPNIESLVRGRIVALIGYISSLQEEK